MKQCNLSNRNARIIDRLVAEGVYKSREAALNAAVDGYLRNQIPYLRIIDLQPADGGDTHSQPAWIDLFNSQEGEFNGKAMLSSYDVLGAPRGNPAVLASIRKGLRTWLMTGTHNSYIPSESHPLAGKVTHDYLSTVVIPKVISLDEIPVLEGVSADKVVSMPSGLLYVRALANDPHARPAALLKDLETLAQRSPAEIEFHTPNEQSRRQDPEGTISFGIYCDRFLIGYEFAINYYGHSRGVLLKTRKTGAGGR